VELIFSVLSISHRLYQLTCSRQGNLHHSNKFIKKTTITGIFDTFTTPINDGDKLVKTYQLFYRSKVKIFTFLSENAAWVYRIQKSSPLFQP
jgi:hypothetical protein